MGILSTDCGECSEVKRKNRFIKELLEDEKEYQLLLEEAFQVIIDHCCDIRYRETKICMYCNGFIPKHSMYCIVKKAEDYFNGQVV